MRQREQRGLGPCGEATPTIQEDHLDRQVRVEQSGEGLEAALDQCPLVAHQQ